MSKKSILIIGAGKRVQSTILPVLTRLEERIAVTGICARSARTIRIGERAFSVEPLEALNSGSLAGIDLIYMAVTKESVPAVLKRLNRFDLGSTDLLIDTPVLCFKHYYHRALLTAFRQAWAAEDCCFLPCFDPVHDARARNLIGKIEEVRFDRSAYKYHGLATLKGLLDCRTMVRASRKKIDAHRVERTLRFSNNRIGTIVEPRDYTVGTITLKGSRGIASDRLGRGDEGILLEPVRTGDRWTGFRIGDIETTLAPEEIDLLNMDEVEGTNTITTRMEGLKRVGTYRLFKAVLSDAGGYPYAEALDDMVIDYYLDKIGFFRANPLMSVKSALGAGLLHSFTRLAGK